MKEIGSQASFSSAYFKTYKHVRTLNKFDPTPSRLEGDEEAYEAYQSVSNEGSETGSKENLKESKFLNLCGTKQLLKI